MDRSQAAEFLLSCVLPVEQAAAVTGDFVEEFEGRGEFWFWSSVLRTVAARVASDFVRRPFLMLGIGITGCLLIIVPAFAFVFTLSSLSFGHPWLANWIFLPVILGWYVRCGMWLGRCRPKSGLASCSAVILFGWMWTAIVHTTPPRPTAYLVMGGVHDVLIICGMLWARYRDVQQTWGVARA
ncbi:MAG TPA: hypothetical protein VGM43_20210 [Bryobacteraceae bacterium]